jgi:hypothetical protein
MSLSVPLHLRASRAVLILLEPVGTTIITKGGLMLWNRGAASPRNAESLDFSRLVERGSITRSHAARLVVKFQRVFRHALLRRSGELGQFNATDLEVQPEMRERFFSSECHFAGGYRGN